MSPNGYNNNVNRAPSVLEQRPVSQGVRIHKPHPQRDSLTCIKTPSRGSGPMALSSILTSSHADPAPPASRAVPSPKEDRRRSKSSSIHYPHVKGESADGLADQKPMVNGANSYPTPADRQPLRERAELNHAPPAVEQSPVKRVPKTKITTHREVEAEFARIEAMEDSDLETPGYEEFKKVYSNSSRKRALDVEHEEEIRRKVRQPMPKVIHHEQI